MRVLAPVRTLTRRQSHLGAMLTPRACARFLPPLLRAWRVLVIRSLERKAREKYVC